MNRVIGTYTESEKQDGRLVLARLLQEADKIPAGATFMANNTNGSRFHRRENLDAVIIRTVEGGFVADVLFKNVPKNVNEILGSPEAHPLPSFEVACQYATLMLAALR